MTFVGGTTCVPYYPKYAQGTFLELTQKGFVKYMAVSRAEGNWETAIADFEGLGSVPIMTIHKSKGLEYHTIVFVGLEDSALFNWDKDQHEGGLRFFARLSRAVPRCIHV